MRYYTGDEGGLVRAITFPAIDKTKTKPKGNEAEKPEAAGPQPVMTTLGDLKINKDEKVQLMCWGSWEGKKHIVVARKSGKVQFVSPEDGTIVKEFLEEHVSEGEKKEGQFVGLFASDSTLVTCTDTGHLRYIPLTPSSPHPPLHLQLPSDLCRMRVHPTRNHIFAVGGKERDLTIYDVTKLDLNADPQKESCDVTPAMENGKDAANRFKREKKEERGVIFRAKNVKNDFLDLRVPVWVTDIEWLSEDATRVVIATRFHQVRTYDTTKTRRPALDVEIGEHPITALCVGRNTNEVVVSDTMSNVFAVDVRTGKTVSQFKGFTGSVTALHVSPIVSLSSALPNVKSPPPTLASVSLDRFLRVHEMTSVHRRLEHKVYLKLRLSCVLVDEDDEGNVEVKEENESEVDEEEKDMWKTMAVVEDRKGGGKRKKRRVEG